jgi:hypothetical protein
VLASLNHRRLQAQKTQELELLLSYLITLDPTPAAFADLLAEHAADPRQVHAQVAQRLEQAWLRAQIAEVPLPAPPLQETLRTLGGILDDHDTQAGFISVVGGSSQLQPFGEWQPRALDALALLHEIAARTALRGQLVRPNPADPNRYETRLRAVGAQLDVERPQSYQVLVSRQTIVVEGSHGYYRVCTTDGLAPELLCLAAHPPPEPLRRLVMLPYRGPSPHVLFS